MSEKKLPPIEVRALRGEESRSFQSLLCALLIRANSSDGLKKIDLMCQAYFRGKSRLPQNPIKIDGDEVDIIHEVVTSLRYVTRSSLMGGREYVAIAWTFLATKENFDRYIAPWLKNPILNYYPYIGPYRYNEEYKEAEKACHEYLNSLTPESYFFTITGSMERYMAKLSEFGYNRLVNQFIVWAMRKVDEWYLELTNLVDQSVFDSMFKTMYGEEKPKEGG